MTQNLIPQTKQLMQDALDHLIKEFKALRTGRVNSKMLDDLKVDSYGSLAPLVSLAQINLRDRELIITAYDPNLLKSIYGALEKSEFSKYPRVLEKGFIRFSVPPMTEEVRRDVVKMSKKMAEDTKVSIRDVRRKSNDMLKKNKENTEDVVKRLEKQIQDLTDEFCRKVDELCAAKEKDVMTI